MNARTTYLYEHLWKTQPIADLKINKNNHHMRHIHPIQGANLAKNIVAIIEINFISHIAILEF